MWTRFRRRKGFVSEGWVLMGLGLGVWVLWLWTLGREDGED